MGYFEGQIDLLRLKNVVVTSLNDEVQGRTIEGVFIPLDANDIKLVLNSMGKETAWFHFVAWAIKTSNAYGQTHCIKQTFTKERVNVMTQEEREHAPFIGGMRLRDAHSKRGSMKKYNNDLDSLPF